VLATPLAERFDDPARWRRALAWLVRCGDAVDLAGVGPLVDYLRANLHAARLRGRTFASVMRDVDGWRAGLAPRSAMPAWPRTRGRDFVIPIWPSRRDERPTEWVISERWRHRVVQSYAVWSLRRRWRDTGATEPVATFTVARWTRTVIELRGFARARPHPRHVALVRAWAAHVGIHIAV
jgi:hypothetical protein